MRVGGTVKNTLKGGGTKQSEGDTKILKEGTSWFEGVQETPLRTMYIHIIHTFNLDLQFYLRIPLSFPNESSNYSTYIKYICNL